MPTISIPSGATSPTTSARTCLKNTTTSRRTAGGSDRCRELTPIAPQSCQDLPPPPRRRLARRDRAECEFLARCVDDDDAVDRRAGRVHHVDGVPVRERL